MATPIYLLRGEGGHGMVLCEMHAHEVYPGQPKLPLPNAGLVDLTCIMCATYPVRGRVCESCGKALHPNWPAVYCSHVCALDDAD